jgi:ABC-type Fe3+ transport system substrate-binding protein
MANLGDSLGAMWSWQAKGAPLVAVPGVTPINTDYFQLSTPKGAAHPNLAKLFCAFMATKDAQAIIQKHESRSSHLVEGTLMQKYSENKCQLSIKVTPRTRPRLRLAREATGLSAKGF